MATIDTDIRHVIWHAEYESLGAGWTEHAGWLLPKDFGDITGEVHALQEHCGLVEKSSFGRIKVTGETAQDFLHRMTSAPINNLSPGEGMETIVTTAGGRFVDWVTAYRTGEEGMLLITGPGATDRVIEHFRGYLFFKDHVEFQPLADEWSLLQFSGPAAMGTAQDLFQVQISGTPYRLHTVGDPDDGVMLTIINDITGNDVLILFPNRSEKIIRETLHSMNAFSHMVGYQAYQIARISAGIPQYPAEINEQHIAPEAHLDSPVDLDSCFAGQEVIARTINYDKIKQHLCHINVFVAPDEEFTTPTDVYQDDQRIGELTSAVWSPEHGYYLGLGYIRTRFVQDDLQVMLEHHGKRISGRIIQKTRSR